MPTSRGTVVLMIQKAESRVAALLVVAVLLAGCTGEPTEGTPSSNPRMEPVWQLDGEMTIASLRVPYVWAQEATPADYEVLPADPSRTLAAIDLVYLTGQDLDGNPYRSMITGIPIVDVHAGIDAYYLLHAIVDTENVWPTNQSIAWTNGSITEDASPERQVDVATDHEQYSWDHLFPVGESTPTEYLFEFHTAAGWLTLEFLGPQSTAVTPAPITVTSGTLSGAMPSDSGFALNTYVHGEGTLKTTWNA